jgi:BlaI family transcriptional regulator, penicillinase repressor
MARPKAPHPTPAELEILKLLWETGPLTVREVLDALNQTGPVRAYTSVMSLLNVMADKDLLDREPEGRAFRYRPKVEQRSTLSGLIGDVWQRAFAGSTSSLVAHLLEQANPTPEELAEIRKTLARFEPPQDQQP